MLGMFKKKPLEDKYGRKNYLANPNTYKANYDNWILLLSSLFVEANDMDMMMEEAEHDMLLMYDIENISKSDYDLLKLSLELEDINMVNEYMDDISDIEPRIDEVDLYYAINCTSLAELQEAVESQSDEDDKESFYKFIWKGREKYETMHYRLGYIAYIMWQVRLAAFFNVINPDMAWKHLYTLAEFARPIISLFPTWGAYHQNILYFHEIYTYDRILSGDKYYVRSIACLNLRKESPCQQIAIDFGIDKNSKFNIKKHSYKYVKRIDSASNDIDTIMLAGLLEKEDKSELWKQLDNFSKEQRDTHLRNLYYIDTSLQEEDYLELPELYPNISYAYYLRGQYFYYLAWEARGEDVSDTVGEENYELFYERLDYSSIDFLKAYELSPEEKNYWADLYDLLSHIDSDEAIRLKEKFYGLIHEHGMDNDKCIYRVSRWKQKRWGGSHEENLDWAREVISRNKKDSKVRRIIYDVLIERYDHIIAFEDNEEKANAIFKNVDFKSEVNQYFDALVGNMDEAPYSISSSLIFWYLKAGDWKRVREVAQTMKEGCFDFDAMNDEYEEEYTELYMNWIRSI